MWLQLRQVLKKFTEGNERKFTVSYAFCASSETQGQLVVARKFLRPNFFLARFDFFPPLLTAPGSPRMPFVLMLR